MNDSAQDSNAPSPRQLGWLKDLAMQTGQSFDWPQTGKQAHEQIERLEALKKTTRADRRRERREVQLDMARKVGGASRVRAAELSGYGSTGRWGPRRLPTEEQLDLLEQICREREVKFVMPETEGEARRMIDDFLAKS